jgi:GNAT superfamily N-acetyltransferase
MSGSPSIEFRSYAPGDEKAILALFEQSYGRSLAENEWRWRFAEAPAGEGIIELAWDGDVLAGHYAVTPVALSIDGHSCQSALSGTTMTHPNYRGLGLFPRLARRCYDRMRAAGMVAVWGFPNTNSHRGFIQDLDWIDIAEIPTFRCPLTAVKSLPDEHALEIVEPDTAFDDLWSRIAESHRGSVLVERTVAYLRWRYKNHPSTKYQILAFASTNSLDGYVVYKRYGDELQIVELVAISADVATRLVQQVILTARDLRFASVSLWLNFTLVEHRALERIGFRPDAPVTYAGALPFRAEMAAMLTSARMWRFSLGDSDVY